MPDLSEASTIAAALGVALAAVEGLKLAVGRLGRNADGGVAHEMRELGECMERTANLQERILERLDREVIPVVTATKHTLVNAAQGVDAIGEDLQELEGAVGRLAGQVGALGRRKTGD